MLPAVDLSPSCGSMTDGSMTQSVQEFFTNVEWGSNIVVSTPGYSSSMTWSIVRVTPNDATCVVTVSMLSITSYSGYGASVQCSFCISKQSRNGVSCYVHILPLSSHVFFRQVSYWRNTSRLSHMSQRILGHIPGYAEQRRISLRTVYRSRHCSTGAIDDGTTLALRL